MLSELRQVGDVDRLRTMERTRQPDSQTDKELEKQGNQL